jgi:hypothetical protein
MPRIGTRFAELLVGIEGERHGGTPAAGLLDHGPEPHRRNLRTAHPAGRTQNSIRGGDRLAREIRRWEGEQREPPISEREAEMVLDGAEVTWVQDRDRRGSEEAPHHP